ncbi:MAG: energy-coupling factor transporter ATPase [Longibaculum muris]|uniref:Energy-coupling factor transporter ATP-binding protein EcfA2 n=1 Tax=Longibaculum muris TaxID=1796628 RepID=A0A4R3YI76_9FIRM|nr:energy-coupling factor transporter ATPase [Longibaculum muris]MBS5370881.1 energy-coupling factor transporter ATPase [Coprobacillus cateniformis]MCR1889446.1 energy-coupling factor transporter ATPase [Longibaculum muris]MED9812041.1 energy-coupling factor transporter ATPase [Longibaculum muris]TCV91008.1 energy-coupling factor transport system ATP-binding protein [Longibaculum muris]
MSITFKEVEHIYSENTPFSYHALKGVNLDIKQGSMTALIGHTGSGKSTLIQHINALLLPTAGEIHIDDFLISVTDKPETLKPLRKKAGLVFQFPEYQLFEETIQKDIIFGPKNFGATEEEALAVAKKVLKLVGLDESYLERSPFDLSGGQKRRIAIAGILAMDPDILILDEPTAGLDPQGAKEMLNLFKKINEQGKTVILVSHDMNQVLEYCDDVVVMNKGRVERHVSVDELFRETEYLTSLSIDLPIITSFILELNKNGFDIDPSIKDINELIQVIGGQIHE